MNIYIYGSKSFKKDVHDELDHSNIKFKIDDSSSISEIDTLDELKHLIENNKEDIFLIDDAKIIKKDALNGRFSSKLKFLIPKDGIEEEYLFEHGIGDISFDSIDELSKHITDKIQAQNQDESSDEFENRDEIHDSISDIVNDAYSEEESIQLNDELNALLVSNDMQTYQEEPEEEVHEIEVNEYKAFEEEVKASKVNENDADAMLEDLMHLEITNDDFNEGNQTKERAVVDDKDLMLEELEELSISNDDFGPVDSKKKSTVSTEPSEIENQLSGLEISNEDFGGATSLPNESQEEANIGNTQGDFEMAGDFSSLDDINESDIIAALNGEEVSISETQVLTSTTNSSEAVSINLEDTDNLSELLTKLLKNKTLEITVKIKE